MKTSRDVSGSGVIRRLVVWVLSIVAVLLGSVASAGDITVTFTDGATGQPTGGVVYAFTPTGSRVTSVFSSSGSATITGLSAGSYVLAAHSFSGHVMLLDPDVPCSNCVTSAFMVRLPA